MWCDKQGQAIDTSDKRDGKDVSGKDASIESFLPSMIHRPSTPRNDDYSSSGLPPPWSLMDHATVQALMAHQKINVPLEVLEQLQNQQVANSRKRDHNEVENEERDDVIVVHKKRHNAIEQRRREKINTSIDSIKDMLPPSYCSSQDKPSKAQILSDALIYVQDVQARFRMLGIRDLLPEGSASTSRSVTALGPAAAAAVAAAVSSATSGDDGTKSIPPAMSAHALRTGLLPQSNLQKQLQQLQRKSNTNTPKLPNAKDGNKKGLDNAEHEPHENVLQGIQYSSEILKLLLSAAGKDDREHDIDPFGVGDVGDHFDEILHDDKDANKTHKHDEQHHEKHPMSPGSEPHSDNTA